MIDPELAAKAIATLMGSWALGFSVGKAVAWVRALRDVA